MFNLTSLVHWQPAQFEDFSVEGGEPSLTDGRQEEASDLSAEADRASSLHAAPTMNWESELAYLKEQAENKGYHEGFILGKNQGLKTGEDEGYAQGYQHGKADSHQQLAQQIDDQKMLVLETMSQLVANFQQAMHRLDEEIVPKLVDIALLAAQKMIGQIPKAAQNQLTEIIKELINQYPPLGSNIQLYVNPNDVASVEHLLTDELAKQGWQVVVDPTIESGGCKVLSEKTEIDATMTSKWQAVTTAAKKGDQ